MSVCIVCVYVCVSLSPPLRSLMKVLSSVEDSVMEVELSEGGTWRPCKSESFSKFRQI